MHIQDRAEQKLKGNLGAVRIARNPAKHRGQRAAGAVARHAQPRRIDAEQFWIAAHMAQGRNRIGQTDGKGMFGRQPVIHRDHAAAGFVAEPAA